MTNFEKAAVLFLRMMFFLVLAIGIQGIPWCILMYFNLPSKADRSMDAQVIATCLFIFIGAAGLSISMKLGKWIARGL